MSRERMPTVLLLGGNSGVGKTELARRLSEVTGVGTIQVDDLRIAIQAVTSHVDFPELHHFVSGDDVWGRSPDRNCQALIRIAEFLEPALDAVVGHHLGANLPVIVEGDGILPAFAERWGRQGEAGCVRSVFIIDTDETRLAAKCLDRGRGFGEQSPARKTADLQLSALYGEWLASQAEALDLPILCSDPLETLAARLVSLIDLMQRGWVSMASGRTRPEVRRGTGRHVHESELEPGGSTA